MTRNASNTDIQWDHELPAGNGSAGQDSIQANGNQSAENPDLQSLKGEREALLDRMARVQAEFENARKRAAQEQLQFRNVVLREVLASLLPVLDSFDRALQAPIQSAEEFRSGIELIRKQFDDVIRKLGVQPVPANGEHFDPRVHEAVEMVDTTNIEDGTVLEELQRGYKLGDQLLRPARVRVARNPKMQPQG